MSVRADVADEVEVVVRQERLEPVGIVAQEGAAGGLDAQPVGRAEGAGQPGDEEARLVAPLHRGELLLAVDRHHGGLEDFRQEGTHLPLALPDLVGPEDAEGVAVVAVDDGGDRIRVHRGARRRRARGPALARGLRGGRGRARGSRRTLARGVQRRGRCDLGGGRHRDRGLGRRHGHSRPGVGGVRGLLARAGGGHRRIRRGARPRAGALLVVFRHAPSPCLDPAGSGRGRCRRAAPLVAFALTAGFGGLMPPTRPRPGSRERPGRGFRSSRAGCWPRS